MHLQKQKQRTSWTTEATTQPAAKYTTFLQSGAVSLLAPAIKNRITSRYIPDSYVTCDKIKPQIINPFNSSTHLHIVWSVCP